MISKRKLHFRFHKNDSTDNIKIRVHQLNQHHQGLGRFVFSFALRTARLCFSLDINKSHKKAEKMVDRQAQIKLLLAELSELIDKHPYLVHSWRFAAGAMYALDKSYQYHVERSSYIQPASHLVQVREVISQINLGQSPDQYG